MAEKKISPKAAAGKSALTTGKAAATRVTKRQTKRTTKRTTKRQTRKKI